MDQPEFPTPNQGADKPTDPRLQPTPDYGTLGPGSDFKGIGAAPAQPAPRTSSPRTLHILAAVVGMFAALIAGTLRNGDFPWTQNSRKSAGEKKGTIFGGLPVRTDNLGPQKEAEALLEQAVQHSAVAVDQISTHVEGWQGQVQWTPQIASLTTAALNSDDLRVRQSGVEVELAAYGVTKDSAGLDYVLNLTDSQDHAQKIWALWAAGLLANRGVGPVRVIGTLAIHLKDDDEDSRRWAVESLALSGTDGSIPLLLAVMHDDPSPTVRERAACGVAQSGLYTQEQRMSAVSRLISFSEDSSLDAQTHGWAFQALGDITHQRFGTDSAAWRRWYESEVGNGRWTFTVSK